jgi:glutamyl-tRNA synthetase
VQKLTDQQLADELARFVPELDRELLLRAAGPVKTRIGALGQARELLEYLWTDPPAPQLAGQERERLRSATAAVKPLGDWRPEPIHEALKEVASSAGLKDNDIFMPARVAVTGKKISPPIGDTLALLPKDVAIARMERAL